MGEARPLTPDNFKHDLRCTLKCVAHGHGTSAWLCRTCGFWRLAYPGRKRPPCAIAAIPPDRGT